MARFFCIFHALSFKLNFFRPEVPFKGETEKYFWGKCSVNNLRIINLTLLEFNRPVLSAGFRYTT